MDAFHISHVFWRGNEGVIWDTLCNIGHIANNCLTSSHIVCTYEYVDDYLPAPDWLRRCWGWPRRIEHGSVYQNITESWMYPNIHYVTLLTYRNLSASSWIEKMNFVRIVGCMSFIFVGIACCMTLDFNALIYNSFWNFCWDQKIIEVWITVILNHVYNKITNALGYQVWIGLSYTYKLLEPCPLPCICGKVISVMILFYKCY